MLIVEDYTDIERLFMLEKRNAMTRTVKNISNDSTTEAHKELYSLLSKYKKELGITSPIPTIHVWVYSNKLNFLFFSKTTGRRQFLADWLQDKETKHLDGKKRKPRTISTTEMDSVE